jgi:hypothetical protein
MVLAATAALSAIACSDPASPLSASKLADRPSLITSGVPDQGAHPYVGLLVFDDADGPAWRCTGSLLSSTIVLTAGHCTDGAVAARIWMDEVVEGNSEFPLSGTTSYDGTAHTYPDYCVVCGHALSILDWLANDVGIVVLSEPVPGGAVPNYAQLPAAGLASTLGNGSTVTITGYGDQFRLVGAGPPTTGGSLRRLRALATFLSGNFYNSGNLIRLSGTGSRGRGGICFGDSGGPVLPGTGDVVVAVNSYGTNQGCSGVGYSTRIDRTDVLSWIGSFMN